MEKKDIGLDLIAMYVFPTDMLKRVHNKLQTLLYCGIEYNF